MRKKQFVVGFTGTVIAAICCFTPLLTIILTAIGLSTLVVWLDYLLLPALAIFALVTVHAWLSKA